jgi:hypothetical protein
MPDSGGQGHVGDLRIAAEEAFAPPELHGLGPADHACAGHPLPRSTTGWAAGVVPVTLRVAWTASYTSCA